jgi:hypothetical protein
MMALGELASSDRLQREGNGEAECIRRLQLDHQLELGRLQDRRERDLCGLVTIKAFGGRQLISDQHHSVEAGQQTGQPWLLI